MAFEKYINRHNGNSEKYIQLMLKVIGVSSEDELIAQTLPDKIRLETGIDISPAISEYEYLQKIQKIGAKNKCFKTYIGLGYNATITPSVVWRNIFENPVWYTSYTPYQAEISQGRLEALLNFQTVITELTGCQLANASLLDEATAAAEAMLMMFGLRKRAAIKAGVNTFFVDKNVFPQTIEVIKVRAEQLGILIEIDNFQNYEFHDKVFGAIVQYPNSDGKINDYSAFAEKAKANNILLGVAADLLSLAILTPPAAWGADIVFGTTQRFGIPMGYGGPHAGYFATSEKFKRNIPGRIIGVSKDAAGNKAYRMALQTREQHIKREKATSNICTAQALLATMAGMYAVYHGASGLKQIALNIHFSAKAVGDALKNMGYQQLNSDYFDTLKIELPKEVSIKKLRKLALKNEINFRYFDRHTVGISLNETTSKKDLKQILKVFAKAAKLKLKNKVRFSNTPDFDTKFTRQDNFLRQPIFNSYRSETEMMRYIKKLEHRDISLAHSMISLGSCTMKLNAATLMLPISNPQFGNLHPFVPLNQAKGYQQIIKELTKDLSEITGFEATSLQPNSGAAGEYTGLLVIKKYLESQNQGHRKVVLIPSSAHGTNPASAVMAGMKVVIVKCDDRGNIDIEDLQAKAKLYTNDLAAFMITYPSTHGVFETGVMDMCKIIHDNGGQVYMDGANMNAQVGLTSPGRIGADVCHLNLHKTFAIPHGGGGPGVGPIGVAKHLAKYLPSNPIIKTGGKEGIKAVAAAPWGSASVLPITYGYIKMLGEKGLKKVTKSAILNANYLAVRLQDYYKILYTGAKGRVAHEMILECRNFKIEAGITEADIAKRLMDYGFHAPTLSFPVHGTLMVEPTESESKAELDRFADAMISIYNEIQEIKDGKADKLNNVLKNAPHSEKVLTASEWKYPYSREKAGFPMPYLYENKFQLPVARLDDAYGDRNLMCTCPPMESYNDET